MVKKYKMAYRGVRRGRTRGMRGRGKVMDFFRRTGKFLTRTKAISKISGMLAAVGIPYAGQVHAVSQQLGLGRARKGRRVVYKRRKYPVRRRRVR